MSRAPDAPCSRLGMVELWHASMGVTCFGESAHLLVDLDFFSYLYA